jgi:hypothetical protein
MNERTMLSPGNEHGMKKPELRGPLKDRYADSNRPHRLLALDGGGIRGLIALGMLEAMEKMLVQASIKACE